MFSFVYVKYTYNSKMSYGADYMINDQFCNEKKAMRDPFLLLLLETCCVGVNFDIESQGDNVS